MSDVEVPAAPAKRPRRQASVPAAPKVPKLWRDVATHREANGGALVPAKDNPFCAQKCKLHEFGCKAMLGPTGSTDPLITVIVDSVSWKEDEAGQLALDGSPNGLVRRTLEALAKETGFDMSRVRWLPLTRCANRTKNKVNYGTKANWCRVFALDDLKRHPPRLILAVGTTALGMLSHKSSAQEWSGKLLVWRGWPDDWLLDARYEVDHPAHARPADQDRLPLWAVQSPRLVYATENKREIQRWRAQLKRALEIAMTGAKVPEYDRPYFRLLETPAEVIAALAAIPAGQEVTYDTETTGLLPFAGTAKLVYAMFRYDTPEGPVCFGFPWNFPESPLFPHLAEVTPHFLAAMYRARLIGHNLGFDILYTYAALPGADLWKLTSAMAADTRQLIYVLKQDNQPLGLELITYTWCPEMAGYEEEFVLVKDSEKYRDLLDPAAGKGGHYALCPTEHKGKFKIYVLGDVETAHLAKGRISQKVETVRRYTIPLADPSNLGRFRDYTPPSRKFVYDKLMLPAHRTLTRVMARGMHVDLEELKSQEDLFPKLIKEARAKLHDVDQRVVAWCQQQEATQPDWKLDLEDREQLKTILFRILQMPIKRLTSAGERLFKDLASATPDQALEYAAIDKYTLNNLVAENPALAPLKEYRKLYKAYTSFVRSMRNIKVEGIDKNERSKHPYLMPDSRVHASFNQCGTRAGRLSSSNPNLQQLPKDSIIKRFYTSRFGSAGCIYQADLSQIELRLLAAACGDPLMVKAYRDGVDLHSLTTSRVFNVPYEHFEKAHLAWLQQNGREKEAKDLDLKRRIGKTTNFLTGYGGGPFGLQTSLAEESVYLPIEECERIVEALFDTYPGLRRHIGLYKRFIMDNACAVSITGRVRWFEDVFSEDNVRVSKALRSGFNHLIQSTASDMMLSCLTVIDYLLHEAGLESILVSTVHDSIVVDAKIDELQRVHEICDSVINNMPEVLELTLGAEFDASWLRILPITGDAEVGMNYLDAKKVLPDPQTGQIDWARLLIR